MGIEMFMGTNIYFLCAGLLTAVTFALHTFVATTRVATPLLADDTQLSSKSRYTNYYCWHAVTITLVVQAGCFFWAALPGKNLDLAVVATVLAVAFLLWNVVLNIWLRPKRSAAPQWMFWLPISVFGIVGLI